MLTRLVKGSACLSLALAAACGAASQTLKLKPSLEASYKFAQGLDSSVADQSYIQVKPKITARWNRHWKAALAVRAEGAFDETGLGSVDTFDNHSKPLEFGRDGRLEIEEATLSWRKRSTRITLGKQTFAWGVLDGLQVTDRFDAVRRREAVFTDQRPERLSKWGARAEFDLAGTRLDIAAALDGSGDQLVTPGDSFSVRAPRFRAGLSIAAQTPDLSTDLSNNPTLGARAARRFGDSDASILVIHGPDTEPVFRTRPAGASLNYDTRTLLGATWQRSAGSRVWRVETALVFDQPVNLQSATLETDTRQRWLGGVGLDWDLRDGAFLNAQLGVDHIEGDNLVRPNTDVISTIKLQKSFSNQTWLASAEVISSLSDGDGTLRPALSWQVDDRHRLQIGADLIWGDREGLFGQFKDNNRVWVKTTWTL
ncbi:MAG: DUF1302 domain-containing protein [Pseudomonadota bacterium]